MSDQNTPSDDSTSRSPGGKKVEGSVNLDAPREHATGQLPPFDKPIPRKPLVSVPKNQTSPGNDTEFTDLTRQFVDDNLLNDRRVAALRTAFMLAYPEGAPIIDIFQIAEWILKETS